MLVYTLSFALCAMLPGSRMPADGPAKPLARYCNFATAEGWTSWSPRAEIAPSFSVEQIATTTGRGALKIECPTAASFGGWQRTVEGIQPGRGYRFTARFKAHDVERPLQMVGARLEWRDAQGNQARPPEYAAIADDHGGWKRVEYVTAAPDSARSVQITLSLQWAPRGTVWWNDVCLAEEPAPRDRVVRVATVYLRPQGARSAADSVQQFCRLVEGAADQKPDLVCLPEGITVVGTGLKYADVAESLPGPTTARLGELAKKLHCNVVAGLYERVGPVVYNTSVLIDRNGRFAGKYRKTHLPREEVEGGITPGDSYPVFDADFGRLGMMICWDLQFPEPARALGAKGAEIIALPIWGGSEVVARARAIENSCYLVSATYDMRSFVVDPAGTVLAEATKEHPFALAEVHLDRKIIQPWLGDMKTRTWRERRPDIPVDSNHG